MKATLNENMLISGISFGFAISVTILILFLIKLWCGKEATKPNNFAYLVWTGTILFSVLYLFSGSYSSLYTLSSASQIDDKNIAVHIFKHLGYSLVLSIAFSATIIFFSILVVRTIVENISIKRAIVMREYYAVILPSVVILILSIFMRDYFTTIADILVPQQKLPRFY